MFAIENRIFVYTNIFDYLINSYSKNDSEFSLESNKQYAAK
ncbi:hypothetical protein SAMN06295967_1134 [Belliella buryatensis]|uniref:Uncharacterized protein n=1 Tax=Belliella buryatensis TaxID=1500549 RepID=A0A239FM62_9BACT|nr:hypothetical protein SAMN06295967_1134 [Belliella buryatensis]